MLALLDEGTATEQVVSLDPDDIVHRVCECMLNDPTARHIAMCGLDVTDDPVIGEDVPAEECLVCEDLDWDDNPCPRCGQ